MSTVLRQDPSDRFVGVALASMIGIFLVVMASIYGLPFQSESTAQSVAVADAPEPLRLDEPGEQPILTITHTGGDSVATEDLAIFLGSQSDGTEFSSSTDWSQSGSSTTVTLRMNGENIGGENTSTYERGDTITLLKTEGTSEEVDSAELRIVVANTALEVTIKDTIVVVD